MISITAPAHPHATGIAVYRPADFVFLPSSRMNEKTFIVQAKRRVQRDGMDLNKESNPFPPAGTNSQNLPTGLADYLPIVFLSINAISVP